MKPLVGEGKGFLLAVRGMGLQGGTSSVSALHAQLSWLCVCNSVHFSPVPLFLAGLII